MPHVLVNPQSGLAETFEPDVAQQKLKAGYEIPLHDSEGNPVSAPFDEAKRLVSEGRYRQPNPQELDTWVNKGKFGTDGQQALTFIEGAAEGVAGGAAPYLENKVLGVPYDNIAQRKGINPGTHMAGQLVGTAAGVLTPGLAEVSLPGIISKAGKAAEAGIAAEGIFGAIAKKAVQGAVEGGLYEASQKIHEGVLGDPKAVSEYALADIGMSAALGGGLGAAFGAAAPWMKHLTDEGTAGAARLINKIADADSTEKKNALDWMSNTATLAGIGHMVGGPVGSVVGAGAGAVKGGIKALKYLSKNNKDMLLDSLMSLNTKVARGVDIIDKHAGSIFGLAAAETPKPEISSDIHEMHEPLQQFAESPSTLIDHIANGTQGISSQAPEVTSAIGTSLTNAVNYLETKRPNTQKKAPLDMQPELKPSQISAFNNTADIVNNPMTVFGHIKTGTLMPQHIEALQAVYPSVYKQMQSATMGKMTDYLSKNDPSAIPYKTKLSLSRFLGQNLDSSLTPNAILSNQMALGQQQAAKQAAQAQQMKPSKSGMEKMKGLSSDETKYQQTMNRKR